LAPTSHLPGASNSPPPFRNGTEAGFVTGAILTIGGGFTA
jgi:hypothetical protein